ncbi:hypothetical protein L1049_018291 [Liquidambar formosana]|uniref:Uncharacterized protein n=1 Tax=Liquidambar formosana TaxID=63359 RepID=A0AAP0R9X5_LIQFO
MSNLKNAHNTSKANIVDLLYTNGTLMIPSAAAPKLEALSLPRAAKSVHIADITITLLLMMFTVDLRQRKSMRKTAPSNESESIDSYESSTRVKGYVCTSSVESPDPSFSVSKCIDVLKTMGLDEDFYVKAVSWLIKSLDNREGFLGLEPEFREALLRKNI